MKETQVTPMPTSTWNISLKGRYILYAIITLCVTGLDQLTKFIALKHIPPTGNIPVIDGFFDLVLVNNYGAAFGFLNDQNSKWQIILFGAVSIIAIAIILYILYTKSITRKLLTGLALISAGAIGNLVDRLRYNSVVDFLDFYIKDTHWPAFNVADIAICTGAALIFMYMWKAPAKKVTS